MKRITAALLTIVCLGYGVSHAAAADRGPAPMTVCAAEDDANCVWHAPSTGNGYGDSFVTGPAGHTTYVPHATARAIKRGLR